MLTADTAGCDTRLLDQSVGHEARRCLRNTLLFRYGWPTVRTEKFELDLAPVKQGTPRVSPGVTVTGHYVPKGVSYQIVL